MPSGSDFEELRQTVKKAYTEQSEINSQVTEKFNKMLTVEELLNDKINNVSEIFEESLNRTKD